MGYNTQYSLSVSKIKNLKELSESEKMEKVKNAKNMKEVQKILNSMNLDEQGIIRNLRVSYSNAEYALHESGDCSQSCKWYDHESNLKMFSKEYPDYLFELSGEGEESGDIWKKYFHDGKIQTCKSVITFEKFDEKKLK